MSGSEKAVKRLLLEGALMRSYPIEVAVMEPPPVCNTSLAQCRNKGKSRQPGIETVER